MSVVLKVQYNEEIRRVALGLPLSFEDLENKLCSMYPQLLIKPFVLRYASTDGSRALLQSQDDLDTALFLAASAWTIQPPLLRLFVCPEEAKIVAEIAPSPMAVIDSLPTFGEHLHCNEAVCSSCGKVLSDVHYKCLNCLAFELCEACEATEGIHQPTHLLVKLRVPLQSLPIKKQLVFKSHLDDPAEKSKAREEKRALREKLLEASAIRKREAQHKKKAQRKLKALTEKRARSEKPLEATAASGREAQHKEKAQRKLKALTEKRARSEKPLEATAARRREVQQKEKALRKLRALTEKKARSEKHLEATAARRRESQQKKKAQRKLKALAEKKAAIAEEVTTAPSLVVPTSPLSPFMELPTSVPSPTEDAEKEFNIFKLMEEFQMIKPPSQEPEEEKEDEEQQVVTSSSVIEEEEEAVDTQDVQQESEEKPAEKSPFEKNLEKLQEMGFPNRERNIELLVKHLGELEPTVEHLLRDEQTQALPAPLAYVAKWLWS